MCVKGGKNLQKETVLNGIFVTFRISEFRPFSVCRDWRQLGFLDQAPDIKLKGNKVLLGVQLPKNSVGTLPKLRSNLLSEERDMIITPVSDAKTALPRIKNWRSSEHLLRLEEYRHWTIRHHKMIPGGADCSLSLPELPTDLHWQIGPSMSNKTN